MRGALSFDSTDLSPAHRRSIYDAPLLSRERELALALAWRDHQDAAALGALTTAYLKLTLKIARQYRNYGLRTEDLVQEGSVGLMIAASKFDPDKGFRFGTYAQWHIRATIQQYVMANAGVTRLGTTARDKAMFFSLRRIRLAIEQNNPHLSPDEINELVARELDVSPHEVAAMAIAINPAYSLDTPIGDADGDTYGDMLVSNEPAADELLADRQRLSMGRDALGRALATLRERERVIFAARRLADPPHTLEMLAVRYGITRERVRQIEAKAFERISALVRNTSGFAIGTDAPRTVREMRAQEREAPSKRTAPSTRSLAARAVPDAPRPVASAPSSATPVSVCSAPAAPPSQPAAPPRPEDKPTPHARLRAPATAPRDDAEVRLIALWRTAPAERRWIGIRLPDAATAATKGIAEARLLAAWRNSTPEVRAEILGAAKVILPARPAPAPATRPALMASSPAPAIVAISSPEPPADQARGAAPAVESPASQPTAPTQGTVRAIAKARAIPADPAPLAPEGTERRASPPVEPESAPVVASTRLARDPAEEALLASWRLASTGSRVQALRVLSGLPGEWVSQAPAAPSNVRLVRQSLGSAPKPATPMVVAPPRAESAVATRAPAAAPKPKDKPRTPVPATPIQAPRPVTPAGRAPVRPTGAKPAVAKPAVAKPAVAKPAGAGAGKATKPVWSPKDIR